MTGWAELVTHEWDFRPRRWLWHRTTGRYGAWLYLAGPLTGAVMLLDQPRGTTLAPYRLELVIVGAQGAERYHGTLSMSDAKRRLAAELRRREAAYRPSPPRAEWNGPGCWCLLHAGGLTL